MNSVTGAGGGDGDARRRGPFHLLRRCRSDRRGLAALEFAIVAPVFMFMLMGMIGVGIYLMFLHELQELSASAARRSVAGITAADRDSLTQQFVANAAARSALLNPADLTVQTAATGSPPRNYSVTVTYSLRDTPIPMLSRIIGIQLNEISRTSTVMFGGS
jgi:Flp pilus assembly protein TadG